MMNRAEPSYADILKTKLAEMNKRWEYIVQKTDQEKVKLQAGLDKFKIVDNGIKDIYLYLKSLEAMVQGEDLTKLDSATAVLKAEQYQVSYIHIAIFTYCFEACKDLSTLCFRVVYLASVGRFWFLRCRACDF